MAEIDQNRNLGKQSKILLDGKKVEIPANAMHSLAEVRAHLELLALRQDRVLASLTVDGQPISLTQVSGVKEGFSLVQAFSIGFAELAESVASTTRLQVCELKSKVDSAVTLVLINPWGPVHQQLKQLEGELRTLLVVLHFLQELTGSPMTNILFGNRTLLEHLSEFLAIINCLDQAETQQNVITLSDVLENKLSPWLQTLIGYLSNWKAPR